MTRIIRPPIAKKLDGHSLLLRHHPGHGEETGGESQGKRKAGSKHPILRKKLHADGQAALNAIAKASRFVADGEVQLGHRVMLLSKGRWREWTGKAPPPKRPKSSSPAKAGA